LRLRRVIIIIIITQYLSPIPKYFQKSKKSKNLKKIKKEVVFNAFQLFACPFCNFQQFYFVVSPQKNKKTQKYIFDAF
jgi:hypothetical protein